MQWTLPLKNLLPAVLNFCRDRNGILGGLIGCSSVCLLSRRSTSLINFEKFSLKSAIPGAFDYHSAFEQLFQWSYLRINYFEEAERVKRMI